MTTMTTATTDTMNTLTRTCTRTPFDSVCVDTIGNIISFCDFRSAVIFARATSHSLRARLGGNAKNHRPDHHDRHDNDNLEHVWKSMFQRLRFCPTLLRQKNSSHDDSYDYLNQCLYRRQLLQNLLQPAKKQCKKKRTFNSNNCFNIPHSYFHFCPIVPRGENGQITMDLDPPPVMWDCDSFCLTSTATGCELVLLDPFDGSLVVYPNLLQVVQEKRTVEYNSNSNANANDETHKADEHAMDNVLFSSGPSSSSSSPQYLLDAAEFDSFQVDLAQYFPKYYQQQQQPLGVTEEFERIPIGVDSKPILDWHGNNIVGNMVFCGRSIHNEDAHRPGGEPYLVCTELVTWFQYGDETEYGHKHTCRFPFSFQSIGVDGVYRRLFVSFTATGEQQQDGPVEDDLRRGGPARSTATRGNRCRIVVYPMVPNDDDNTPQDYFPDPLYFIHCQHPVSSFSVDPTGTTLLVSTIGGTVEIWNILQGSNHAAVPVPVPVRTGVLRVKASLQTSIHRVLLAAAQVQKPPRDGPSSLLLSPSSSSAPSSHLGHATTALALDTDARRTENDPEEASSFATNHHSEAVAVEPRPPEASVSLALVLSRQPDLERYQAPIESFLLPRHLALHDCGFVTSQHSREEGTSLLLWNKRDKEEPYQIVSLINLPLLPRRRPRFWYDGIRLIVFGQDHIGLIILIYHVLNSMDDDDAHLFSTLRCCGGEESSGGVYNLTNDPPRVRLANRVRHVGLGGISSREDSIHMTCNERLLVVNTKTGNLLPNESSCAADGLLVIDLQGHGVE
jgi:hypothetical protein